MKNHLTLTIFLCFLQLHVIPQGSWEKIPLPTDAYLRSVFFTDSVTGWVAGDAGTILRTGDGGNTWEFQESSTGNNIVGLFFLDGNTGWAIAHNLTASPYGTELLNTTDGGENWSLRPYPEEDIFMNCILFTDSLTGWMGGSPHAIVRTADGGLIWEQMAVDTSILAFFPVLSIRFHNDRYGYACGGVFEIAGVTWRTTDGGDTWYAIEASDAPADEVFEIHIFDSLRVLGAGGDPDFGYGVGMLRTFDGGLNWDYEEIGYQGNAFDLDFRNGLEAWAPLGPREKLIYSLDGGDSWTETDTPESTRIFDIMFPDSLHGYAVGREGAVLKYNPPLGVGTSETPDKKALTISAFPNPVRESSMIHYQLIIEGEVVIRLLGPSGREVRTLVDSYRVPGEYGLEFQRTGLSCGVYFVVMEVLAGNNGQYQKIAMKMVLL